MRLAASSERNVAVNADEDSARQHTAWRSDVRVRALERFQLRPQRIPAEFWIVVIALSVAIALRLFVAPAHKPVAEVKTIRVLLIDPVVDSQVAEPPLPQPPPLPARPVRSAGAMVHVEPRATAEAVPPQTPRPQLFNPDGSIRLPAMPAPVAPTPEQVGAELMQRGHNIVHCRKSRFARGYARDETVGNKIARKYLVWIGLYNAAYAEAKAAQREAEQAAACDD